MNPVEFKTISLTQIKSHPQNPRAMMRQHVVAGIVEGIRRANGFKLNHAITVRPANGHYEVISGHHRIEAAKLAGLDSLPCWVEVMDDETAFYELIRNNNQGELSPLEIGLHALEYVEADKRGRGATGGGYKKYAEAIGYSDTRVSAYRQAAKVFRAIIPEIGNSDSAINPEIGNLLAKTHQLEAIHAAPSQCWLVLVELMLSKGWTVQDTRKAVKRAQEYQIPPKWEALFLPLPDVVYRGLDTAEFSPTTIKRIILMSISPLPFITFGNSRNVVSKSVISGIQRSPGWKTCCISTPTPPTSSLTPLPAQAPPAEFSRRNPSYRESRRPTPELPAESWGLRGHSVTIISPNVPNSIYL